MVFGRSSCVRSFVKGPQAGTAKCCCRRGRVASSIARRANIGFSLLVISLEAQVAQTTHIVGKDIIVYDGLSRGKTGLAVGLPPHLFVELSTDSPTVRLCDPLVHLVSTEQHTDLSVAFLDILSTF